MATITISGDLISHVRFALDASLKQALTGNVARHGNNAYSHHAFPAYVSAVASVEAFVNEQLLGASSRLLLRDSPLWLIQNDALDKLDLKMKLILVPQMLFNQTFDISAQPYQDFDLLVKLRNDVVHYKLRDNPPKYLSSLEDRGIAITSDSMVELGADYPWPSKLSTTEGIRWAHNTACAVVNKLVSFIPDKNRDFLGSTSVNFKALPKSKIDEWFSKNDALLDDTKEEKTKV